MLFIINKQIALYTIWKLFFETSDENKPQMLFFNRTTLCVRALLIQKNGAHKIVNPIAINN